MLRSLRLAPLRSITRFQPILQTVRTMSDIKTLEVDASELKDGQMKSIDFHGGKVLLSKVNGEIHATSANCTHYGAPLEKGVLALDGRVVCPWHGACFNLTTGDIEDAPGLDSLYKYGVEVKDGKIIVSASEKELKSKVGRMICKPRKPNTASEKETVVIIGGGSGGLHTYESLREHNFAGKIVLISKEPYAPIDRTKLSKQLIDDPAKLEWRPREVIKKDFDVELYVAKAVVAIDTDAQKVTSDAGVHSYDHLVISPGAIPKRIPIPGADLSNVLTIRTPKDIAKINAAVSKDSDIIIIGTSFIGLEAAGALAKKELKSLTVVGVDEVPFEAMLGRDIGVAIVDSLKAQGVKFYLGAQVEEVVAGENGKAASLRIKGQKPLPATIIIMGTGVEPATHFMSNYFKLEKDGGITVDEHLRVPGVKNVYAIGDIAHYPQFPDGHSRRVEHWNLAGNHGRHVGKAIGTQTPQPFNYVPIFWSSIGKGLRYVGTGAGFDDQFIDGNPQELNFALYQSKEGKITAVATMGRDPINSKSAELMRLGKMPTMQEIKAGKNVLEIEA